MSNKQRIILAFFLTLILAAAFLAGTAVDAIHAEHNEIPIHVNQPIVVYCADHNRALSFSEFGTRSYIISCR